MRSAPRKKTSTLSGFLIFLLTISVTVTLALVLFSAVNRATSGDLGLIILAMLAVIIAMSAICTGIDVLRRRIMIDRPVSEILSATEKIASGDFTVKLSSEHSYERYDDYDLIKENINAMAAELRHSELMKKDFISSISHEIKTPLSVIRSYVELIAAETDPELRKKYTDTVVQATARLSSLVTDILSLSRLENQGISIERERIELAEMLAEIILTFESKIETKELSLECELDDVFVSAPRSMLDIVFSNLISNAVKFTEPSGKISITLKMIGEDAVVTVSDTGCGISQDIGKYIFDKFYQADTSHAEEGNGLGLALVKRVIDLLGGEISVKSELGVGSSFAITLRGVAE